MVGSCASGGQMSSYGESSFTGYLQDSNSANINLDLVAVQFLGKVLQPGDSLVYTYYLMDPADYSESTYYNSIEVSVAEEPTRSATGNVAVGNGGCARCPSTWPVTSYYITQGPDTNGPGSSHSGVEAVDFGVGRGTSVHATHDGMARVHFGCTEGNTSCNGGYGNFVEVFSNLGFSSIYAHLSLASVADNTPVTVGTEVALSGNSGNSSGPHLHYEFRKPFMDCNPGQKVMMREPYIPSNSELSPYRGAYLN